MSPVFVIPGKETAAPNPNNEYTRRLNVRILGMVETSEDIDDEGLLSKEMEDLLKDVVKAMLADINRGNPDWVDYTFFQGCDPLYDWGKQQGFLAIDFVIQYHHDYTTL